MKQVSFKWNYAYLLVGLLGLISYVNTIGHDYAWDDAIVITENSRVQDGWGSINELFANKRLNQTEYRYGYRPITLLTFATEVEFFGLNPHVSHTVNVLLYTLMCMLLLYVMSNLFSSHKYVVLGAVILFTVHPLHTEVVANIKSRDEILALLFSLLSLYGVMRSIDTGSWKWIIPSLIFMTLAFLSKESAATFIGIIVVSIYYQAQRVDRKTLIHFAIPGLLAVLVLLVRFISFSGFVFESNDAELIEKGVFHYDVFLGNPLVDAESTVHRIANGVYLLWYYFSKTVFPWPLVHDYGYSQLEVKLMDSNSLWIMVGLILIVVAYAIVQLKNRTIEGFGLAWFFISSVIYLQIFAITPDLFAERYEFVGLFGLLLSLVSLVSRIVGSAYLRVGIMAVSIIIFLGGTLTRNRAWASNDALYEADMPNLQNCARSLYNYGLFNHGKYYAASEAEKPILREKIIDSYERALQVTNRAVVIHMDLGSAYMEFGEPEKAYKVFKNAQELFWKMSIPYVQLGKYHMSFEAYDSAFYYFEKSIEYGAANADYYYLAGVCQFKMDNDSIASEILAKGEEFEPSASGYYTLFARVLLRKGDLAGALQAIDRGYQRFPSDLALQQMTKAIRSQVKIDSVQTDTEKMQ